MNGTADAVTDGKRRREICAVYEKEEEGGGGGRGRDKRYLPR